MIKNYRISTCGTVIFYTGLNCQEKELWTRMKKKLWTNDFDSKKV